MTDNRARLLLIYQMLLKSSKEKPVTIADITRMLEHEDIKASRKTIYQDLIAIEICDARFKRTEHEDFVKMLYWLE